jgi:hypothetical protein
MNWWKLIVALFAVAGCSGPVSTTYAAATSDVMMCERLHSGGVLDNVPSVFEYADCKTNGRIVDRTSPEGAMR